MKKVFCLSLRWGWITQEYFRIEIIGKSSQNPCRDGKLDKLGKPGALTWQLLMWVWRNIDSLDLKIVIKFGSISMNDRALSNWDFCVIG